MFRFRATPMINSVLSSVRASSSGKDFYKVLGVSRTASKDEIKKAYRKRALETHPDQGGKKEEFAEVAEAYECLNNPEKKQVYDQYGSEAVNNMGAGGGGMGGFHGRNAEDVFSEFFRQAGGFGDMFGGGRGRGPQQVPPVEVQLKVTLEEIANGASKTVRVTRPSVCSDCRGNGTKSQQAKPKCSQCNGSGQVVQQHRMGAGMVQQVVAQCPRCGGQGSVAKKDDECARCHGLGYRQMTNEVNLNVPVGVPGGVTLAVQGEGGTMPNAIPGDLHVHIEQIPHKDFTRRGDDLTVTMEVSLSEALLGVQRPLRLLDGRTVSLKAGGDDSVLKQDAVIKIAGEGMPKAEHGGKGDLYVFVNLQMPKTLNAEQRAAIETAFGKPAADANASVGNTVKGKVLRETKGRLEEQKASEWSRHAGGGRSGGRRGGQQQQAECAQQ